MSIEEALITFKENSVSTTALIKMLESRVGNIERNIESDREQIKICEKRIEDSEVKWKQDKAIIEALKALSE